MISTELLDKFKKLYEEKYNIILNEEEALKMATDFLNLMKILMRPDPPKPKRKYVRRNSPINQLYETQ